MKIQYKIGNLLESGEKVIAHGCNCQGKFNAGIAKDIRARYPLAYERYLAVIENYKEEYGRSPLGTVNLISTGDRSIFNCYTQEYYGNDGKRYVVYAAVANCIRAIDSLAKRSQLDGLGILPEITRVAFPLIGCGLAGGDWNVVSRIIEEFSENFQPIVYVLDEKDIPNN